jgi:DMSO reductase anchor subunit
MNRALSYIISAGIAAFGIWIFFAGLGSRMPAFWESAALIPLVVGILSGFSDC